MTNRMNQVMVCRRIAALGLLTFVLSALVVVPSCSDEICEASGEGCPCATAYECADSVPNCHVWMCDGTCHLLDGSVGSQCLLRPCSVPGTCAIGYCTTNLTCVECEDDSQCGAGHTCEPDNVCSRCDDGVKNGDETDVDCGGSCPLCPGTCNVDADCLNGYCWEGLCVSCHDGIQNGDETGVDCGPWGSHCLLCLGYGCSEIDAACVSQNCEDARCCPAPCPLCYDCGKSGECEPVAIGYGDKFNTDPANVCDGPNMCDGTGRCALAWGEPCTQNEECASLKCLNGKCS